MKTAVVMALVALSAGCGGKDPDVETFDPAMPAALTFPAPCSANGEHWFHPTAVPPGGTCEAVCADGPYQAQYYIYMGYAEGPCP